MPVAELRPQVLEGFGNRVAERGDEHECEAGKQDIRHQGCVGIKLECFKGGVQVMEQQVESEGQAGETGADLRKAYHERGNSRFLPAIAALVTVCRVRFVET